MRFSPGQIVFRRHYIHDLIARVWAARVVVDDDRGLLLWVPDGSPWLDLATTDGLSLRELDFHGWMAAEKRLFHKEWQDSVLMWHPRGAAYSIWYFFEPDGAFRGWYANLEVPGLRWAEGIDTVDWDLDVWVAPDRTWRWKDEDEFSERLAYERYWVEDEAEVRAAGAEVVKKVEAGEFPFDGSWTDFRPDPAWITPAEVPPGWDAPQALRSFS